MKYLFVNASPHKNGNTVALAQAFFGQQEYETLHLVDYKIYSYGQDFDDDQFNEVVSKMSSASVIVIGSPVYWHNMSGSLRNLLDRFYGAVDQSKFANHQLFVLFQGAAPEQWMIESVEYTMSRFAGLYGMTYMGMATNKAEAKKLGQK